MRQKAEFSKKAKIKKISLGHSETETEFVVHVEMVTDDGLKIVAEDRMPANFNGRFGVLKLFSAILHSANARDIGDILELPATVRILEKGKFLLFENSSMNILSLEQI